MWRPGLERSGPTLCLRQMRSTGGSVGGLSGGRCQGYLWPMDLEDGLDAEAGTRDVQIRGSRLLLRALQPGEIEEEWRAMVTADPMVIAELPREAAFKARLQRSGHLEDGWLDLAIDLGGVSIGRIQTFVPPGRALPRGTFELGIELRERLATRATDAKRSRCSRTGSSSMQRQRLSGFDRSRQRRDANGLPAGRLDTRRIIDRARP